MITGLTKEVHKQRAKTASEQQSSSDADLKDEHEHLQPYASKPEGPNKKIFVKVE